MRNSRGSIATLAVIVLAPALTGCCGPHYGWVLKGDWGLELNRVAWLEGRGDTYAGDACQGAGAEMQGGYELPGGPNWAPLDPGFHPVPTREMFTPPPAYYGPPLGPQRGPTRSESPLEPQMSGPTDAEDLPSPPPDDLRPSASVPRRLNDSAQRASWAFGRRPARRLPNYAPQRSKQPVTHVWRPDR